MYKVLDIFDRTHALELSMLSTSSARSSVRHQPSSSDKRTLASAYAILGSTFAYKALHNTEYMQSVLIIQCFICKVSLLFSALYATRP